MGLTDYASSFVARWSPVIGGFRSSLLFREEAVSLLVCCRTVTFFSNFNSVIPVVVVVAVVRVKSDVNSLFDSMRVAVRVSINKKVAGL